MDPVTIALCFDYKHDDRGSNLLKEDGSHMLDYEGKVASCDGKWKDPGNKDQCLSATSKVHANHGQSGPHQSSCKSCCKACFTDKLKHGCCHHHFTPCLKNNGNPRFDLTTNTATKKHHHAEHMPESDSPLSPMELKALHDLAMNSCNVCKLQF